jgi:Cell division septal protein
MKLKFNVKRELKIVAAILVVLVFIAFTERKHEEFAIRDVVVKIENGVDNHFLDESDVLGLMRVDVENIRGAKTSDINLKAIEAKIKKDPFIKQADLYTDLKGNLIASIALRRPIARIIRADGPDGYIAEDGTVMPVSEKFTARVLLISGAYTRKILEQSNINSTEEGAELLKLIRVLKEDDFWSAQIAQMDIDAKGRLTLFPQVGDERIEFGRTDNQSAKLKKLKIYYKEIVPKAGWNKYKRVSLQYDGQIVAE